MPTLTFATRRSALARWQTNRVIQVLQAAWPGLVCHEVLVTTRGDRIPDRPLPKIGGKGLFTQELEHALLTGEVDAAVHSLKDLPIDNPPGLTVGAIPPRADVRDVLISAQGYTLDTLPEGAIAGTSSLRRTAQLLAYRSDLRVEPLRGNVDTRLRKARQGLWDAVILAGAGLLRLGLERHVTQWLPLEIMLPAPGQGALAVQCRADDEETLQYLTTTPAESTQSLDDPATRRAATAERAFLSGLGGGCAMPVAAYATIDGDQISLRGLVASLDGQRLVRVQGQGRDPQALGTELARRALAQGANTL